jgi:membrane fusion protein, copper/silver efflux system
MPNEHDPSASLPVDDPRAMAEGEEAAPPGVKLMGLVRWMILGAAAFVAVVAWWSYASAELRGPTEVTRASAKYHCPMHPQIVSNEPGECPICHMTLEPMASNRSGTAPPTSPPSAAASAAKVAPPRAAPPGSATGSVAPGSTPPGTTPISLTLDRIQSIGVRTAVVGEGRASPTLRATAVVAPTEQGVVEVHVRTSGFVERLQVNQTGIPVLRQQALFAFYSPEIYQVESELLASNRWSAPDAGSTASNSSRHKLELLGMSPRDIDQVIKTGEAMRAIPIYAPQAGYITKKNVVAGSYVTPDMTLYEIQDLSQVYVVADVFQRDVDFLQKGTPGRFTPTRHVEQPVEVRVDLVYPTLNAESRTTRVRMIVRNPKGVTFRPGEYGTVEFAAPARKTVTVPRDAVVDTGLHAYVFVVQGEGIFSPREVVLGEDQGEMVTVLAGISPGDRVVSGATFLIDSESRLQASAAQAATLAPAEPKKASPGEGPQCLEIDRDKFPDKWTECQKCVQVHHGMGSMEADCKNVIPKPWK